MKCKNIICQQQGTIFPKWEIDYWHHDSRHCCPQHYTNVFVAFSHTNKESLALRVKDKNRELCFRVVLREARFSYCHCLNATILAVTTAFSHYFVPTCQDLCIQLFSRTAFGCHLSMIIFFLNHLNTFPEQWQCDFESIFKDKGSCSRFNRPPADTSKLFCN